MYLGRCLDNVRDYKPRVHCITNYVTVNDVANIIMAVGARPIMADEPLEVAEIQYHSAALCLNMGTLNERRIEAMILAGQAAKKKGHPVLLDPVGVGASEFRKNAANKIISVVKPNVIKGNISEIKALALGIELPSGVDAADSDLLDKNMLDKVVTALKTFAKRTDSIVVVTGKQDLVTDGNKVVFVENGSEMLSKFSGSGCQLSGLISAFTAGNDENRFEAVVAAAVCYGCAGEIAQSCMLENEGNMTYKNRVIDAVSLMNSETLTERAKLHRMK